MLNERIVNDIHQLDTTNHIVIGTILRKFENVKLNENKNGIMVNVSTLPQEAIDEVMQYLEYVKKQKTILEKIEEEAKECKQLIESPEVLEKET